MKGKDKLILDVCCGGRMMWFDKNNPLSLFLDKYPRPTNTVKNRPLFKCDPDIVMDFTQLKFPDKSFKMVVMDPPHSSKFTDNSYMKQKYGRLSLNWREELSIGFKECWRVLDDYGTFILKWNDHEIALSEVLKLIDHKPLFGHPTGKIGKTMWMCFMKLPSLTPNKQL